MPRKPNAVAALVTSVLPMQDIVKLSIKEACQHFADRATISQRAFAEMGKLHFAISAHLKKGQTIYGELRKLGVKDSTISNASYAARVWGDLIAQGHLKEADYDTFTFADCLGICRVGGDKSKRKLTGEEIAMIVKSHPADFDSQLESLFNTGLTVEEAEAQALRAQQEQERLAKEAKEAAERAAAEKQEKEKQAAIAMALEAERLKNLQSQASPPVVPVVESTGASVDPSAEVPSAVSAPIAQTPPPVEPVAEKPQFTVMPPAAPEPPVVAAPPVAASDESTKIVEMPDQTADPDAALPDLLRALDEVPASVDGMSYAARKAVFEKMNQIMGILGDRLTEETAAAAA